MMISNVILSFIYEGVVFEKQIAPNGLNGYTNKDISNAHKWQGILSKDRKFKNVKVEVR